MEERQRELLWKLADAVPDTGGVAAYDVDAMDAGQLRARTRSVLWAAPPLLLVLDDVRSIGQLAQARKSLGPTADPLGI